MKFFKKLAFLGVAITLCFGMGAALTACVGNDDNCSAPASSGEAESVTSEETSKETSEETSDETSDETSEALEENEQVYLVRGENTIEVAAGETVTPILHIMGAIFGSQYNLFWTSANAVVTVKGIQVDGTSVNVEYTPMLTIAVSTANGAAESIAITVGDAVTESEDNILTVGNHTVDVPLESASVGIEYTFKAPETAVYTISSTDANANVSWFISIFENGMISSEENFVELKLTEGATVTVRVGTYDEQADTIEFSVEKTGEYAPYALIVGDNCAFVPQDQAEIGVAYTFTVPADGIYEFSSWVSDGENIVLSFEIDEETKSVTDSTTLVELKAGDVLTVMCYVYDESAYSYVDTVEVSFTIKQKQILTVGENTIAILGGEVLVEFSTSETGGYTFTASEGVTLSIFVASALSWVEITEAISVEADSNITIKIVSDSATEATVTVTKA